MTNTLIRPEIRLPLESSERMTITERSEIDFDGISVPVDYLDVPDSPDKVKTLGVTDELSKFEEVLRNHPTNQEKETIATVRQLAREEGFDEDGIIMSLTGPVMDPWRELMPSALALEPLYSPIRETMEQVNIPYDKRLELIFTNALDAIAIRARGKVTTELAVEHVKRALDLNAKEYRTLSIGCGAAGPILNVLSEVKDDRVTSTLYDINPKVLGYATDRAQERGLGARVSTEEGNLVTDYVKNELPDSKKGTVDLVDIMGVFEYFKEGSARELLKNSFAQVKPGGVILFGNMLSSRGQKEINQRVVQWPRLSMRTIEQDLEIIRNAGLPVKNTRVYVPSDGLYAIFAIEKDLRPVGGSQGTRTISGLGATAAPSVKAA